MRRWCCKWKDEDGNPVYEVPVVLFSISNVAMNTFVYLLLVTNCAMISANNDAKRLYDDLMSSYNSLIRPVANNSDKLIVKMALKLSQLVDVVSCCNFFLDSANVIWSLESKVSNHDNKLVGWTRMVGLQTSLESGRIWRSRHCLCPRWTNMACKFFLY